MRARQGGTASIVLEIRDQLKYGKGGRSYDNLVKRAGNKIAPETLPNYLLANATKSNAEINDAALKGAKFLKNGGRAVVILSISATAYILLTAPEDKLERILYEEISGAAGGMAGGAGVGLCILLGIATSGWGLLACGVIGGGVGGVLGAEAEAGEKLYLYKEEYISNSGINDGFKVYDPNKFMRSVP